MLGAPRLRSATACSFWGKFGGIIGWRSHLGGCHPPPPPPGVGNPGSATGLSSGKEIRNHRRLLIGSLPPLAYNFSQF